MTKYNTIIILIVILVIGLGTYGLGSIGALPVAKTVKEKKIELKKAENTLKTNQEQLNNLREIAQNWGQYQSAINLMNVALPNDEGVPEIHLQMQSLVSAAGLEITSLNVGAVKKGSGTVKTATIEVENAKAAEVAVATGGSPAGSIAEAQVNLVVKGEYSKFLTLFGLMQQNIRPIYIKTIAVAPDEKAGISATLTLSMPYLKTKENNPVKSTVPTTAVTKEEAPSAQ